MPGLKPVSDWFLSAADVEARTPIAVGATTISHHARITGSDATRRLTLAKLVELRRRQSRLTVEALATKADVDLEDILSIEQGEGSIPEPRTLHQIAQTLSLPERRLLELSGHIRAEDQRLREASIRFAARSEPIVDLTPGELEALEEYVKILAQS